MLAALAVALQPPMLSAGMRGLTFELSRPWRQGPLADESNMLLGFWRPVGLAGAGRLERRVRPHPRSERTGRGCLPPRPGDRKMLLLVQALLAGSLRIGR